MPRRSLIRLFVATAVATLTLGLTGAAAVAKTGSVAKKSTEPVTLRLGYFPNVTHAPAIVGVEGGIFQKSLGSDVPRAQDLQLRHRGDRGDPGRRARRQLHRPEPHHHRVDAVRQGREGDLGRRRPVARTSW